MNEIKDNNLKGITSADMNILSIKYFDRKNDPPTMNNIFETEKIEPEPAFKNTMNKTKENNLKSIASAATNTPYITSFGESFDPLCINNSFE